MSTTLWSAVILAIFLTDDALPSYCIQYLLGGVFLLRFIPVSYRVDDAVTKKTAGFPVFYPLRLSARGNNTYFAGMLARAVGA